MIIFSKIERLFAVKLKPCIYNFSLFQTSVMNTVMRNLYVKNRTNMEATLYQDILVLHLSVSSKRI
jgi:hypothetical protein